MATPPHSHMAYYQHTVNWKALEASIDDMFPVKRSKPEPTPEPEPQVFCERYVDFTSEPRDWLRTMPEPVKDTQAVRFARVSRTLTFQGTKLNVVGDFEIPPASDPDYVQAFVDASGLCAESYNAKGEVVSKYVPSNPIVSFI